jgi:hypothetical protein
MKRVRKAYVGGARAKRAARLFAAGPRHGVFALRPRAVKRAPAKKRTIQELVKAGVTIGLKPQPYSKEGLTDGDFLTFQPYKGGWLLSHRGVSLGSIKKKKAGWDLSGTRGASSGGGYGEGAEKVQKATRLLDEYYAAGGR